MVKKKKRIAVSVWTVSGNVWVSLSGSRTWFNLYILRPPHPPGQAEDLQSGLSSPAQDSPLDSPLSFADLTLDSTGELTVEDVRDFLT